MPSTAWHLLLASASPRRLELLKSVGLQCRVQAPNITEELHEGETPHDYVARLAQSKAQVVLTENNRSGVVVLAADTTVVAADAILEKPQNYAEAVRMWSVLSGKQHHVLTGVCVSNGIETDVRVVSTQVTMAPITDKAMREYWASGEPQDKAGGYAIQGLASAWVTAVAGSFSNVVGLPLFETNAMLTPYQLNWL